MMVFLLMRKSEFELDDFLHIQANQSYKDFENVINKIKEYTGFDVERITNNIYIFNPFEFAFKASDGFYCKDFYITPIQVEKNYYIF